MNSLQLTLRASLLAITTLGSAGTFGREGDQMAYRLEVRVLKVPSSPPWSLLTVESGRIAVVAARQPAVQLGKAARIAFGHLTMSLDGDVITWNGESEPPEASGIEVLSAPQLAVLDGKNAELRIDSGPLEYFEREEDGRFALRTTSDSEQPGLTLAATVHADGAAGAVKLDCSLRIVRCTRRLPLPGVALDVGPPVITQQETRTSVLLDPGDWCLLGGHSMESASARSGEQGGDGHGLMILVRVTPIPGGE